MTAEPAETPSSDHAESAVDALVVIPGSSNTELDCVEQGAPRLRVAAPLVEGAANAAVVRFFSSLFELSRELVTIVAGATGRRERVLLRGLKLSAASARLERSTSA